MPKLKTSKPSLPVIKSLKPMKSLKPLPVAKPTPPMLKRAIRPPLMKR